MAEENVKTNAEETVSKNFIENIIMFLLITIFVAIKNYVDLEKKVKELNKKESFTNAQKYVII